MSPDGSLEYISQSIFLIHVPLATLLLLKDYMFRPFDCNKILPSLDMLPLLHLLYDYVFRPFDPGTFGYPLLLATKRLPSLDILPLPVFYSCGLHTRQDNEVFGLQSFESVFILETIYFYFKALITLPVIGGYLSGKSGNTKSRHDWNVKP